jgi:hypothetical protein
VQFVVAGALLLAFGVEVLRRQTAREYPGAVATDLSDSARSTLARMRGRPEPPVKDDEPPSEKG